MPRPATNNATKEFKFRLPLDLRKAFLDACKRRNQSAASRIRTLIYNDLPADAKRTLPEPVEVAHVEQDYREKGKRAAGSSSGTKQGQTDNPGPLSV